MSDTTCRRDQYGFCKLHDTVFSKPDSATCLAVKCSRDPTGICVLHGAIFPVLSDGPSIYCLVDHRDTARDLANGARGRIETLQAQIKAAEQAALRLDRAADKWDAKLKASQTSSEGTK